MSPQDWMLLIGACWVAGTVTFAILASAVATAALRDFLTRALRD